MTEKVWGIFWECPSPASPRRKSCQSYQGRPRCQGARSSPPLPTQDQFLRRSSTFLRERLSVATGPFAEPAPPPPGSTKMRVVNPTAPKSVKLIAEDSSRGGWGFRVAMCLLWMFLPACASVSVVSVSENRSLRPSAPHPSLVVGSISSLDEEVAKTGGTIYLDQQSGHLHHGAQRLRPQESILSSRMGEALRKTWGKAGFPTVNGGSSTRASSEILVTAQTWKEDGGHRPLRTLVGLGAGRSRLEAKFYVFNPAVSEDKPWLTIHTSGGSNREPGILFSLAPSPYLPLSIVNWSSATASLALHGFKGLEQDASRTGKTVALMIAERLAPSSPKHRGRAKTAGHVPLSPLGPRLRLPVTSNFGNGLDSSSTAFLER